MVTQNRFCTFTESQALADFSTPLWKRLTTLQYKLQILSQNDLLAVGSNNWKSRTLLGM